MQNVRAYYWQGDTMIGDNAKMTVVQVQTGPKRGSDYPFQYRVKDATNTTLHRIGELLRTERVNELITMGITVKIVAAPSRGKVR